jgi:hypothetical protein
MRVKNAIVIQKKKKPKTINWLYVYLEKAPKKRKKSKTPNFKKAFIAYS